jgi:hypothetical protein
MQNGNHTHQSVSTVERQEATWRRSSVVGRKDESRQAARRSEERCAGGVVVDHVAAVARRSRRVESMVWSCF